MDKTAELKCLRVFKELNGNPLIVESSFSGGQSIPDEHRESPDRYVAMLKGKLLPLIGSRRLAHAVDIAVGAGGLTLEQAGGILEAAAAHGFRLSVASQEDSGNAAAHLALTHRACSFVAASKFSRESTAAMARSDVVVTMLPGQHYFTGTPYPDGRQWIDSGAAVALGTGYDSFRSPSNSMPSILSLACTQMNLLPAEAVMAATHNAACSLGISAETGSLQAGRRADLLILNIPDYREIPMRLGANPVVMTIIGGDLVYPRLGLG